LAGRSEENAETDTPSPEAAFARIWQWFGLEAVLEDRRIVTLDLLDMLFAEEVGGGRLT
jgi:hypothetical protein